MGMGTLFLLGEAFAVAIAAALVGAVIVGAVVVFAAICWIAFFFKAAGARDWWWFADLVLTPLVGLLAGIFISQHTAALDAWAMAHGVAADNPPAVELPTFMYFVFPVMGVAFFYGIFGTWFTLAQPRRDGGAVLLSLGAYLGFAFYGGYAALLYNPSHTDPPKNSDVRLVACHVSPPELSKQERERYLWSTAPEYTPRMQLEITNHSSKKSNYVITGEFVNMSQLDAQHKTSVFIRDLEPGGRTTYNLAGAVSSDTDSRGGCNIAFAARYVSHQTYS